MKDIFAYVLNVIPEHHSFSSAFISSAFTRLFMDTNVTSWVMSVFSYLFSVQMLIVWQVFSILGQPPNAPVWLKNERACTLKKQK